MSHKTNSPKRACDGCHRRKVKCTSSGAPPCDNCRQSNLWCTYHAVPKKKGPKGSRAKVIHDLRDIHSLPAPDHSDQIQSPSPDSAVIPVISRFLPPELVETCVDYFFRHLYPTQPILERRGIQASIGNMHNSVDDYCLIASFCAYMLIQPNIQLPSNLTSCPSSGNFNPSANIHKGILLLNETHWARRNSDYISNPSIKSIITAFFLFGSHFCLEKPSAYFYLREATTLALLIGMDKEQHYTDDDIHTSNLRRRLFWLLFVTERAYALQTQKPLSLHNTIALPQIDSNAANGLDLIGFIHLVNLFKPFNDTFVGLWNQSIDGCTAEWTEMLQTYLSEALPTYLKSTETQAVDLKVSQQWLRTMIWQLSITNQLLSSTATSDSMRFTYPISISRDLVAEASQFNPICMEVHGIGLTKKIFDVACTLVDVMSIVPVESYGLNASPRDSLNGIFKLMSKLRGGQERYIPLLLQKVNGTLSHLPGGTFIHGIPPSVNMPVSNPPAAPLLGATSR